jgi:hypothetical protein
MRLICWLRGHHRSVERAQYDSVNGWRSVCRHCERPMVRLGKGDWRLVSEVESEAGPAA